MPDQPDRLATPRPPLDWAPVSATFLGMLGAMAVLAGGMVALPDYARWLVFPLVLVGWLISLCLHEFGHAIVAYHRGDRSVRAKGYLTLDPLRYTDLQYSIVWPLVFLALGGIGLPGGAVYVNTWSMMRADRTLVSAGGPLATLAVFVLLLAAMAGLTPPPRLELNIASPTLALYSALAFLALLQLTALIFNLLPVPGLDGWGIIEAWLPPDLRQFGRRLAPIAPILLVVLLLFPGVNRAFWDAVYGLSQVIGLDVQAARAGLRLFAFWR
ncbi:MAG: site-2 protease family protein [Hyphomicrobiaceae bacterium]|nr:site-2 protease family protein [Hyphomicrobiaceae bacterium]